MTRTDNKASRPPTAWDDWVLLFANRDELAVEYAAYIRDAGPSWTGWPELNRAILDRWSMAGLRYIKEKAWKLARTTT